MGQRSHSNVFLDAQASAGPHAARRDLADSNDSGSSSDTEQPLSGRSHRHASSDDGSTATSVDSVTCSSSSPECPKVESSARGETSCSEHGSETSVSTNLDGSGALSAVGLPRAQAHANTAGSDCQSSPRSSAPEVHQLRDDLNSTFVTTTNLAQLDVDDDERGYNAASGSTSDAASETAPAQPADEDGSSAADLLPRLFVEEESAHALFHRNPGVSVDMDTV